MLTIGGEKRYNTGVGDADLDAYRLYVSILCAMRDIAS